jgi:hypothetical protein
MEDVGMLEIEAETKPQASQNVPGVIIFRRDTSRTDKRVWGSLEGDTHPQSPTRAGKGFP